MSATGILSFGKTACMRSCWCRMRMALLCVLACATAVSFAIPAAAGRHGQTVALLTARSMRRCYADVGGASFLQIADHAAASRTLSHNLGSGRARRRVRPLPKTRASAFPEDDAAAPGGDEVIVFDTPLLTSAADALPGTEARLAEFINPDGQEFEAVDTEEAIPEFALLESTLPGSFKRGNDFWVSAANVSDEKPADPRDPESAYVNTSNNIRNRIIFQSDATDEGFLLQAVQIRDTLGYLAVHDSYLADRTDDGGVRVILHQDVSKAALWEPVSRGGETVLEIIGNRAVSGRDTVGRYLAIGSSPRRGPQAFYLAAAGDINQALVVNAVAEAPTNTA